jgi:hypothetical protein
LVVMKDAEDAVFGVWVGEGVGFSMGGVIMRVWSRESSCFLLWSWVRFIDVLFRFLRRYVNEKLDVFRWTGKNDYVALCEPGFLSFGGGCVKIHTSHLSRYSILCI